MVVENVRRAHLGLELDRAFGVRRQREEVELGVGLAQLKEHAEHGELVGRVLVHKVHLERERLAVDLVLRRRVEVVLQQAGDAPRDAAAASARFWSDFFLSFFRVSLRSPVVARERAALADARLAVNRHLDGVACAPRAVGKDTPARARGGGGGTPPEQDFILLFFFAPVLISSASATSSLAS